MSLKNNILFKVGAAPIQEPTTIILSGQKYTVSEGYLFTLKLFEDGRFRLRTQWHVSKEDSEKPDFKKETVKLIEFHKNILIDAFKQTRIRMS